MLLQDFLEQSSARLPDKTALVCNGSRLTYSEIDGMANKLASALIDNGVQRGDRVVIYLGNTVETVVGLFAALKASATFVLVNPGMKFDKLAYIVKNCRPAALLSEAKVAGRGYIESLTEMGLRPAFVVLSGPDASAHAARHRCAAFDEIQQTHADSRPARLSIDLDLACIIYTSGSTGEPKGVMCDHSNMVFAASSITEYLQNVEDDIVINVLPLSFDYGLYQLLMTFKFGGTLILEQSFTYPAVMLQQLVRERVTGFPGVPTIYAVLLKMDLSGYDLSSLRYITNTAAALPPSHIQELRKKFPWVRVYSMYGLTETKRTLYLPPEVVDKRPGSVGIAIPGTEVWLEDESGNRLPPGGTGELVVRGRHVMRGYWEAPELTAKRYRPGRIPGERLCYTGDLFRTDEEGYLYFVARKDDIIKSRGEKVAPKEVENVLCTLAGVVEAAVVGVPDPVLGHAIKAFVVAEKSGLSEAEVMAHCRANLEDFMVPKYVEFRAELPKIASGKVDRKELAQCAASSAQSV